MHNLQRVNIPAENDLDPITVFLEDFGPQQGQITVVCWGSAWTCYWGGMGKETVAQFVATATKSYLVNKLMSVEWQKQTKRHERYLGRIVEAVQRHLSDTLARHCAVHKEWTQGCLGCSRAEGALQSA